VRAEAKEWRAASWGGKTASLIMRSPLRLGPENRGGSGVRTPIYTAESSVGRLWVRVLLPEMHQASQLSNGGYRHEQPTASNQPLQLESMRLVVSRLRRYGASTCPGTTADIAKRNDDVVLAGLAVPEEAEGVSSCVCHAAAPFCFISRCLQ
jgi:hypothetical protein